MDHVFLGAGHCRSSFSLANLNAVRIAWDEDKDAIGALG